MTEEDKQAELDAGFMDQAEEYLRRGEDAGLTYPTRVERDAAKMQLMQGYVREAKQANVPEAAAASEGGQVVGADQGEDTLEDIDEKLDALRRGAPSHESMKKRRELNEKKTDLLGDVTVTFNRD